MGEMSPAKAGPHTLTEGNAFQRLALYPNLEHHPERNILQRTLRGYQTELIGTFAVIMQQGEKTPEQ